MEQLVAIDSNPRLGDTEKRQEKQNMYMALGISASQPSTHSSTILPLYDSLDVMGRFRIIITT